MVSEIRTTLFLALALILVSPTVNACSVPPEHNMYIQYFGLKADDVFIGKIVEVGNVNLGKGFQTVYVVDVDTLYRGRKSRRKYVRDIGQGSPELNSPWPLNKRYVFCVKRDKYGLYMEGGCNYPAEFPYLVDATSLKAIGKGVTVSAEWPVESPPTPTYRLLSKPGLWGVFCALSVASIVTVFLLRKRANTKN